MASSSALRSSEVGQCLTEWFADNGGYLHPFVEVVHSDAFGHHLRVKQGSELAAGNHIVSCPHAVTISVLNAEHARPPWPQLPDIPVDRAAEILTRFFLVEEYLMQEASFWWPYVRMLPQPGQRELLTTPIWYDEEDLVWIAGTNLAGARLSRLAAWQAEHSSLVDNADERTWKRPFPKSAYTLTLYHWAATILSSRSFPRSALSSRSHKPDGKTSSDHSTAWEKWVGNAAASFPVLLPVFDLLNHDPSARVLWDFTGDCCIFSTDSPIGSGSQVWNNYGAKGNEELILGYGFSVADNDADSFAIAMSSSQSAVTTAPRDETKPAGPPHGSSTAADEMPAFMRRIHDPPISETFRLPRPSRASPLDSDLAVRISTMVANRRENTAVGIAAEIPARSKVPLRNKLSTASQLLQTLHGHKQRLLSRAPPPLLRPQNRRQCDAKVYRQSQTRLLTELVEFLDQFLKAATESPSVLSLGYALQRSPEVFILEFRAAIHESLRTRNAGRIRRSGLQRVVWTLWVCTLWICLKPGVDIANGTLGPIHERLAGWTRYIRGCYGEPLASRCTACSEGDLIRKSGALESTSAVSTEFTEIAGSCLDIVRAAAAKYPDCIYADPRWTSSFLAWGSEVADESLMMYPTFEETEEIEPELLLVLEP